MSGQGGNRRPRTAESRTVPARRRKLAGRFLVSGIFLAVALAGVLHFANTPRSGAIVGLTNLVPVEPATSSIVTAAVSSETNIFTNFPPRQLTKEDAPQVINYGNNLLEQGKTKEAILVYQEALKLAPDDEEAHFDLAFAYSRNRQIDAAIKEYMEALRLWPDYPEAHNNLGNILAARRNYDEAVTHFRAALKTSPEYPSAMNGLGKVLVLQGKTAEATNQFSEAIRLDQKNLEARYNLANALLTMTKVDEAIALFQEALQIDPQFKLAADGLARAIKQRQEALKP